MGIGYLPSSQIILELRSIRSLTGFVVLFKKELC